jgi:HD-GYP domain-containing protein (c-di-GMP phosphodiesterase class II)
MGYERLRRMDEDDPILLDLVRHHHERVDGKGYPDGLDGDDIPVAARYFSVIDTFDALTSIRPYRMEVGHDAGVKAIDELKAGSGSRYDPRSVRTFAELFESGGLEWILSYFNDKSDLPKFDGSLPGSGPLAGPAGAPAVKGS